MIFALGALLFASEPNVSAQRTPYLDAYYVCTANRLDYLAATTAREEQNDQLINSAVSECAEMRSSALAEFRKLALKQPKIQEFIEGKSDTEVTAYVEDGFNNALRNQLKKNLAKDRQVTDASN